MNFWMQVLMWVLLVLASLVYLGYLVFRLAKKGLSVFRVAEPMIAKAKQLSEALATEVTFEKPESNLLDDVNLHQVERAKILKKRARAAEQRQRRLIENLKNTQESELNNGRT
jgi:cell division protein FtsB